MITVHAFEKRYGAVRAAAGVSFEAHDGRITTLLGLNGSGKSTTLRAIAGTLRADAGSISIDGLPPGDAALARVGVFPDRFGLYPRLTVREHLEHSARLRGLSATEAIEAVSGQVGLAPILDRRTQGFSEGQRMRVGLAMALLHGPQNVVLDEPTRGLDVQGIRQLRALLRHLKEEGRCVLFSSHVLAEVEELADRIVLVHQGRVIETGTPAEMKAGAPSLEAALFDRAEVS